MTEPTDHDIRLTQVERALSGQGIEIARQGTRLDSIERDVGKVLSALDRMATAQTAAAAAQAAVPQPLSWKAIGGTLTSVAAAGIVVWQIVSMAPVVTDIRNQLTTLNHTTGKQTMESEHRLDKRLSEVDGKFGRVQRLEDEMRITREALGWRPTIARSTN